MNHREQTIFTAFKYLKESKPDHCIDELFKTVPFEDKNLAAAHMRNDLINLGSKTADEVKFKEYVYKLIDIRAKGELPW